MRPKWRENCLQVQFKLAKKCASLVINLIQFFACRCGVEPSNDKISYKEFLRRFQDRSEQGMPHKILANPLHRYDMDCMQLFFYLETVFAVVVIYVICRLGGLYCKKLWTRSWKCCPSPRAEGCSFSLCGSALSRQITCLFFSSLFFFQKRLSKQTDKKLTKALQYRWAEKGIFGPREEPIRLLNSLPCPPWKKNRESFCTVQYECYKDVILIIRDKRKYSNWSPKITWS